MCSIFYVSGMRNTSNKYTAVKCDSKDLPLEPGVVR